MGVVCMGATASGPQFLRAIDLRSPLGMPDEWGDVDRACHLKEHAALVRSCKDVVGLLYFCGLAAVIYFDILREIAIPLTLFIMALGFTAWVAHIYSAKFETSLSILFGVANLALSILYYRFLYHPIGTVEPSWAERLG